jgi:1-acyl-sn-glycerol-3-phosphate acyltransferase
VETLRDIVTPDDLLVPHGADLLPRIAPEDIALLQYTSGSTGAPKGVVVPHAQLLTNLRAMATVAGVVPSDVFVSWLPLYHDMGLIGAWLGSLVYGFRLVLMSPLSFLSRPQRWLWAMHEHRATLTAAPNFAYALCTSRIADAELEGLDLSALRMVFNGAEPVSAETVRKFVERFAPFGLRPDAMAPVYGLAETCLGLTFTPVGRGPRFDRVRREPLLRSQRAEKAAADDTDALSFVACGRVIPGHEIRVVDESGFELPDRSQGRLEFRGPSSTPGYYRNDAATRRLRRGDWLDTGDLAYLDAGELFVTGRVKDVIIRAGRNVHPQELEEAVGRIDGVRTGCVAAFGGRDDRSGTERLVVLAETRETSESARGLLRHRIQEAALELLGMPADDVVLASPRTVLKTSSGKIRRAACRELYERGALDTSQRPVWLQVTRIAAATAVPRLRRLLRVAATWAYAAYAWAVLAVLTPPVWLGVLLLPRLAWRRALCRLGARLAIRLSRLPMTVEGADRLPNTPFVIAANHASYADVLLLSAVLPVDAAFVAKVELRDHVFSRVPLDRLAAGYVERFDLHRGVADALGLSHRVRSGETLAFFPEGTFTREPGLRPFHMGAFVIAAETGAPVVPVAIRGARSVRRERERLIRRHPVHVTFGEPIHPESTGWEEAVRLRDATRAVIAADCGEPDLVPDSM